MIQKLSDDELLHRLSEILRQSRRVESELVAHIAEVDERRLYAREACSSMFTYCTEVLNMSEAEAYLRIRVARASRKHPELLKMLEDGRIHLTGAAKLSPHLTDANREAVLPRAAHKSKAKIEELVAEVAPKPDVAPAVRKLPAAQPSGRLRPDTVEPLAPARYKVQFTASAELRDKLERLRSLMPDGDLAAIIEEAVTEKLERLESKRFGKTKAPRKTLEESDTSPSSRYIPAPVRRTVTERDGNRCTYVNAQGRRCNERKGLQFHHHDPFGRGGDHSPENIKLMCAAHNRYLAECEYGKDVMGWYRAREPEPIYYFTTKETRSVSVDCPAIHTRAWAM